MGTPLASSPGVGGGILNQKEFKAAQIGGPSGGCITKENLNTPTDYESISRLGAIMGSGGLIAMDEDTCMVDTARYFMISFRRSPAEMRRVPHRHQAHVGYSRTYHARRRPRGGY